MSEYTEYINCNLCGEDNYKEFFKCGDLTAIMCQNCSLVYLNPRPSAERYKTLYSDEYQKDRHNIFDYEQAIRRLNKKGTYNNMKNRYMELFRPFITQDSEVLDIGCGWGALIKMIADNLSLKVTGIEMSKLAVRAAKEHFGVNVYEETLEEFANRGFEKKYDFIILKHVLEHFLDPLERLKDIKKLLSERGFLCILIPNLSKPDEALDKFFHIEHTYYFTPLTVFQMLKKTGLKLIDMVIFKTELMIIATREECDSPVVYNAYNFENKYSKENILKIIKKHKRKYGVLRLCRKLLFCFLGFENQKKVIIMAKKIFERR